METPQTLTRAETKSLLDYLAAAHPKHNSHRAKARNHGLAVFLLETGLRVGELVQLRLSDVLFKEEPVRTLIIREEIAKLHTRREIPVSLTLAKEIKTLKDLIWYWHTDRPETFCWYRRDGNKPLTTRAVEAIINAASMAALGRPVHPHMLRHTFATEMMRVTSARIVQDLLGHADLRSTQIYTHPNGDDRAAAIAAKDAQERKPTP